jgi:hypothetical protein
MHSVFSINKTFSIIYLVMCVQVCWPRPLIGPTWSKWVLVSFEMGSVWIDSNEQLCMSSQNMLDVYLPFSKLWKKMLCFIVQETYGFIPRTNGKPKMYISITSKEPHVLAGAANTAWWWLIDKRPVRHTQWLLSLSNVCVCFISTCSGIHVLEGILVILSLSPALSLAFLYFLLHLVFLSIRLYLLTLYDLFHIDDSKGTF